MNAKQCMLRICESAWRTAKQAVLKIRKAAHDLWFWYGDLITFTGIIIAIVAVFLTMMVVALNVERHDRASNRIESDFGDVGLVEVSVRGERHEYLHIERGAVHLPNCKFCKQEGGAEEGGAE